MDTPAQTGLRDRVNIALAANGEDRDVEYKSSQPWKELRLTIAKSAMAMSNLRDGGLIIIGVAETQGNGWDYTGISEEHLSTYKVDEMIAFINKYAAPPIKPTIFIHNAPDGKKYCVIFVSEFDVEPVICACSHEKGLRAADVYHRPKGMARSEAIKDAIHMAELIELAAEKRARAMIKQGQSIGLKTPLPESTDFEQVFDEELGAL